MRCDNSVVRRCVLKTLFLVATQVALGGLSLAADFTQVADLREAKTVSFDQNVKTLQFSDVNRQYFQLQREHLRSIHKELKDKYFEMDHVVQRFLLARLMKTHAFLYGDPGGAKSAVARDVLSIPYLELRRIPGGQLGVYRSQDVFSLQLHQMTSDVAIKGYADFESQKDAKYRSYRDLVHDSGTLVYFENALLDEIDKGNPVALAALLDVLNEKIAQHGPVSLKVRTKTVTCTSNMTLYEFIKTFAEQAMESNARALLDRFPFKVFVHNFITRPELRDLLAIRMGEARERSNMASLANPGETSLDLEEVKEVTRKFPEVDFDWLQALVRDAGLATPAVSSDDARIVRKVTDSIASEMRQKLYQRRVASELEALNNPEERRPIYFPPTIFSTRNSGFYGRVIALSAFLDLLLVPEEKLSTASLMKMLEVGLPIDMYSTWRLQDILLTAAPGDPVLAFQTPEDGKTLVSLNYGEEMTELRRVVFDKRQEYMLQYIAEERADFKATWEAAIKQVATITRRSSGILAGLLPEFPATARSSTGEPSIEIFLQQVKDEARAWELKMRSSIFDGDSTGPTRGISGASSNPTSARFFKAKL